MATQNREQTTSTASTKCSQTAVTASNHLTVNQYQVHTLLSRGHLLCNHHTPLPHMIESAAVYSAAVETLKSFEAGMFLGRPRGKFPTTPLVKEA